MKDPYQALGVSRTATIKEIRRAYKGLARKCHPDVSKDAKATEKFKEINAAYDILGDEKKKKLYDDFGEASLRAGFDPDRAQQWKNFSGGHRPRSGRNPFGSSSSFDFGFGSGVNMEDILGSMFSGGSQARGPAKGKNQTVELMIPFMTCVTGSEENLSIRRPNGTTETLKVKVPAGAAHNTKLRLKGQGLPPPGGGPCGDLYVVLKVSEHSFLRRNGQHLEFDLPITFHEALAGAKITVPTPTGKVKVTIPTNSPSGTRLRIKGRGIQAPKKPGDLFIVLRPTPPGQSNADAIKATKLMETLYDESIRKNIEF